MDMKLVVTVLVIASMPAFAEQGEVSKATVADVQKVVQIIIADKAKTAQFCEMMKLDEQMGKGDHIKDLELEEQRDAIGPKLGPEYIALMKVYPDSSDLEGMRAPLRAVADKCAK
jgi:hypothetical protein